MAKPYAKPPRSQIISFLFTRSSSVLTWCTTLQKMVEFDSKAGGVEKSAEKKPAEEKFATEKPDEEKLDEEKPDEEKPHGMRSGFRRRLVL